MYNLIYCKLRVSDCKLVNESKQFSINCDLSFSLLIELDLIYKQNIII